MSPSRWNCSAIVFRCLSSLSSSSYSFWRAASTCDQRGRTTCPRKSYDSLRIRRSRHQAGRSQAKNRCSKAFACWRASGTSAAGSFFRQAPVACRASSRAACWRRNRCSALANCRAVWLSGIQEVHPSDPRQRQDLLGIVRQQAGRGQRLPLLTRHTAPPQSWPRRPRSVFPRPGARSRRVPRGDRPGPTAATIAAAGAWPECRRGGCPRRPPPARRSARGVATTWHNRAGAPAPGAIAPADPDPEYWVPHRVPRREARCRDGAIAAAGCRHGRGEPCIAASKCSSGRSSFLSRSSRSLRGFFFALGRRRAPTEGRSRPAGPRRSASRSMTNPFLSVWESWIRQHRSPRPHWRRRA